ncbi:MAG: hypothetical protein GXP32_07135 [Kiritimatiellaeota bacterium]|nr:hypothetical protein [Kiritimatiellota bacterium]
MINGRAVAEKQLKITERTVFSSGGVDLDLVPAKLTPVPEGGSLSLDGEWAVMRHPFDDESADLAGAGADSWEVVEQPGKVFYSDPEGEKVDIPNWNRISLDHIDENDGAILVKEALVPSEWSGGRIFLRFDAVYPAGIFHVNGKKVGEHYSGLTPVEFELVNANPGEELTIAVRLLRKHKFVKMDMPRHALEFAGLAQSAYLFFVPNTFVKDYHLITELHESLVSGSVRGVVSVEAAVNSSLSVVLSDGAGEVVSTFERAVAPGRSDCDVELKIANPKLWNDECPNLYDVEIRVGDASYSYKTGFRRLDLSPEGARLNGNFVKFRGINHLTFHREYGLHTPKEWLRESLSLMKKANINAIRTHFTGPSDLVDLCDEMGFYLLQELPIDWGTNYIHDTDWVAPALMRLEGAIRRDRHHPSIMVWSVGNENMPESAEVAEDGWNHLRTYDLFCKALDPSRATMFPPPGPANKIKGIFELRFGDVADIHYSFKLQKQFNETGRIEMPNSWEADMTTITREEALERGWSGCWFSSEYGIFNAIPDVLNGPYLSVISDKDQEPLSGRNTLDVFAKRLRNEWGNMRFDSTCLGGAYFPWLCAGAGKGTDGNPWGWTRWGEDANWGVVTADLLPKPQFWALRVLFAPVWFPERVTWDVGSDAVSFKIMNQYNSINLNECVFRTQLNAGATYCSMMRKFSDIGVECAPGETGEFTIPLDESLIQALSEGNWVLCRVTMLDPKGFSPVTADIQIVPEDVRIKGGGAMTVGPDAVI